MEIQENHEIEIHRTWIALDSPILNLNIFSPAENQQKTVFMK